MKSNNPIFNTNEFKTISNSQSSNHLSAQGVMRKTVFLFAVMMTSVISTILLINSGFLTISVPILIVSMLGALGAALYTTFRPLQAKVGGIIYAAFEGVLLTYISLVLNAKYSGIVFIAVGLTLGLFAAMLLLYMLNLIKVTENFRTIAIASTLGLGIFYFFAMILRLFGFNLNLFFGSGLFSIGFSIFVLFIASMNLILDFNNIEQSEAKQLPKELEWFFAFSLMVTLVWIYVEMLKLLEKLTKRR